MLEHRLVVEAHDEDEHRGDERDALVEMRPVIDPVDSPDGVVLAVGGEHQQPERRAETDDTEERDTVLAAMAREGLEHQQDEPEDDDDNL